MEADLFIVNQFIDEVNLHKDSIDLVRILFKFKLDWNASLFVWAIDDPCH